jgi:uroporphyrinogen-III synthase
MSHCVLLTRPLGSNDVLSQMLGQRGIRTLERPMLEIKSVPVNPAAKAQLLDFDQFDVAIFVSKNAVTVGIPLLEQYWPQWPQVTWLAVGQSTAKALEKFDINADFPVQPGSEGLLGLDCLRDVMQTKILIVRGGEGRKLLAEELLRRGAEVSYLEVYARAEVVYPMSLSLDLFDSKVDIAVVTSAEGLSHLAHSLSSQELGKLHIVVPSGRIERIACDLGCTKVHLASGADDESLLQAILETTFLMKD